MLHHQAGESSTETIHACIAPPGPPGVQCHRTIHLHEKPRPDIAWAQYHRGTTALAGGLPIFTEACRAMPSPAHRHDGEKDTTAFLLGIHSALPTTQKRADRTIEYHVCRKNACRRAHTTPEALELNRF